MVVCAVVGAAHTTATPTARVMKMPSWLKKTNNDAEASSSPRHRRSQSFPPSPALLRGLPPAPRPRQNRRYVPLDECEQQWRDREGIDHNDVSLPTGWHLIRARLSVLQMPQQGPNSRRRYTAASATSRGGTLRAQVPERAVLVRLPWLGAYCPPPHDLPG
jgi:hypothetical protein